MDKLGLGVASISLDEASKSPTLRVFPQISSVPDSLQNCFDKHLNINPPSTLFGHPLDLLLPEQLQVLLNAPEHAKVGYTE